MSPDPWRALALSYAPRGARPALEALFALDIALGSVLRTTREPMVGQMRLAWWREALQRLDTLPAPAEPVLQALAVNVLPLGISGASLADLVDGWEPLLGDLDVRALADHGRWRGRLLFETAGRVANAGRGDPVGDAGEGWALADLAVNLSDDDVKVAAHDRAMAAFDKVFRERWSANGRALGALALIARRTLDGVPPAGLVLRLARFRLTGR